MEIIGVLVFSFLLGLSGAMAPGPLLTVCIAESTRRGFIASVLICIGHSILELGIAAAILFGLQRFISGHYGIALAVSALGGAFLLWMAYGMIAGIIRGKLSLKLEAEDEPRSGMHPISAGILISASNPYWFLWWMLVGGAYLLEARTLGIAAVAAFYVGHISSDFAWYMLIGALVTLGVAVGKRLQVMNTIYRGVMLACALFLALMGAKFIITGYTIARTHQVPQMRPDKHLLQSEHGPLIKWADSKGPYGSG